MSSSSPMPKPPTHPCPEITPSMVSAAYKRALRYGTYWRLRPEERTILLLARRLRAIKSPTLRQILLGILEKVWKPIAISIKIYEEGLKVLDRKIKLAIAIGAVEIAEMLKKANTETIRMLGIQYLNTPLFYRG